MEAMDYLHCQKVYYGDMKPENLLVFRDLRVKLGDLGVSIKLPGDATDTTVTYLKGLTTEYSIKELSSKLLSGDEVTMKELWENDSHSMWKTF